MIRLSPITKLFCCLFVILAFSPWIAQYILFPPLLGSLEQEPEFLHTFVDFIGNIVDINQPSSLIRTISRPRTVGSPHHKAICELISNRLSETDWHVFHDRFTTNTVVGEREFTNIIAIDNLGASSYVIFAAHYDSKQFSDFQFEGAVDAAASCSILLAVASSLKQYQILPEQGIMFVFFDGEEAFINWTASDSLYGSRHLASLFSTNKEQRNISKLGLIKLDQESPNTHTFAFSSPCISSFVLLDLLGAADAQPVQSMFKRTETEFKRLASISTRIKPQLLNLLSMDQNTAEEILSESPFSRQVYIEDDHEPFRRLGIPIVQLMPSPFPKYWHTANDTIENLDRFSIYHWTAVIFLFIACPEFKGK